MRVPRSLVARPYRCALASVAGHLEVAACVAHIVVFVCLVRYLFASHQRGIVQGKQVDARLDLRKIKTTRNINKVTREGI